MLKFVVLTRADLKGKGHRPSSLSSNAKTFVALVVGDVVAKKHDPDDQWRIEAITGKSRSQGAMTYASQVTLVQVSGSDGTKTIQGSTIQTGYVHVPSEQDGTPSEARPDDSSQIAFHVDNIRNFYPRKGGRPGTRIMTTNGVPYVVEENFQDVLKAMTAEE